MVQENKEQKKNLIKEFDEGLGTVYERFRLNYLFQRLLKNHQIQKVLEYPIYGMTGVDGINSIYFAQQNIPVELVDCDRKRLQKVQGYWKLLGLEDRLGTHFAPPQEMSAIALEPESYDLVWNFAALWFYPDADKLISNMLRLSRGLILISVNNWLQPGYPLRKYILDKDFFIKNAIDTRWIQVGRIRSLLRSAGAEILEEGVFDTPPWPDTCLPLADLKSRLGIKTKETPDWFWSMLAWYAGEDPELEKKVRKFMFIEDSPLPQFIKQFWSHHRYLLARRRI